MSTEPNFVSLFEFMGKPAGRELGAQVNEAAKKMGVSTRTREVSTPNYTGKVMLYPEAFLKVYFNPEPSDLPPDPRDLFNVGDIQDSDLPF